MKYTTIINKEDGITTANVHISQVLQRIYEMQAIPELRGHAQSLLGPRTRGSTTTWGLEDVDKMRPAKNWAISSMAFEVTMPEEVSLPGCRYFCFTAPELIGKLGAKPLSVVLSGTHANNVKVRNGAHGYELFIDRSREEWEGQGKSETCDNYIVIGPDETGNFPEVVYTWHPGRPLAPASKGLTDSTAVKEHNG